jgi:hypothetical protein
MVSVILVPQGAEHQAVCQGLKSHPHPPAVIPIPIGETAVMQCLQGFPIQEFDSVLVMGLCGSLSPEYKIGAITLYQDCVDFSGQILTCDRTLTQRLQNQFQVSSVRAFNSDRVICSAAEKRELGEKLNAKVVDMEAFAVLKSLDLPVAMLRVVSDDAQHDLPDLSGTIDANGNLKSGTFAIQMFKRPIAATRLIRGAIAGLNVLRELSGRLDSIL